MTPYFLPYQQAWIDDNAQIAIAEKSRRIGFTYAEAYRSVERRIRLGTDHYFASRDRESARLFLDDCAMFARVFGAVAQDLGEQVIDEKEGIQAFVLRFSNGAKIMALSSNPDVFRGKGGDVTLDEFAFHRSQRLVLKGANASAVVWGHQLRILSTHNGEGAVFNLLILEIRAGKRNWSHHKITLVDAVAQGLAEVIKASHAKSDGDRARIIAEADQEERCTFIASIRATCIDSSEWDEEYMCIPNSDAGAYLSYELIDSCVDPSLVLYASVLDLPAGKIYHAGYDVGRRHDLCVLWVTEQIGDVHWMRLLQTMSGEDRRFSNQERLLDALLGRSDVERLCIDQTGMGEQLAEQRVDKFPGRAEGVILSGPRKVALAAPFKGRFEDRRYRLPQDDALREDLHKTRKIVTTGGNVRLAADSDDAGHADRFWAGALECEAASSGIAAGMVTL